MCAMQFDPVKSGIFCCFTGFGIKRYDSRQFLFCQLSCHLRHCVWIYTAGHWRDSIKGADTLRTRMCDLRNNLTPIRMDLICKTFILFDALFIPETKCISKIRHIGIHTGGIHNDTAHAAFGSSQPVACHLFIHRSVLAFIPQ